MSLDETTTMEDVNDLYGIFSIDNTVGEVVKDESFLTRSLDKSDFHRTVPYLEHPVFNSHHSETRIVRYMKSLENKDVSLVHSMIPLVSESRAKVVLSLRLSVPSFRTTRYNAVPLFRVPAR